MLLSEAEAWRLPGAGEGLPEGLQGEGLEGPERVDTSEWQWLDTFDWRLHRAGLRLVEPGESDRAPLRELRSADSGRLLASERTGGRFVWDLPRGPMRDTLEPVLEMRALLALVRVESRHEVHAVRDLRAKIVARLHVLTATAWSPEGGAAVDLEPRLEIEALKGYEQAARRLHETVAAAGLAPLERPLFEQALAAIGRQPADYSSKIDLRLKRKMPAARATRRILLHLLSTLEANEAGTRQALDTEFLHDFRVAVRRTRSAISQIKGVLPAADTARFRDELAWLQRATGVARDLDVYLLHMPDYEASLPAQARADLAPLRAFMERRRERAYRDLIADLDAPRYTALLRDWRAFLEHDDRAGPKGNQPMGRLADRRIWKVYQRLLQEGYAIGSESPAEALHEMRKTCKKLRYLMEFFRSLYPEREVGGLIKSLKRLQENLGDFHDLHVQAEALGDFSREMAAEGEAPPETLLAMGRLVEGLDSRAVAVRADFADRFARFARVKNVKRFRRLLHKG